MSLYWLWEQGRNFCVLSKESLNLYSTVSEASFLLQSVLGCSGPRPRLSMCLTTNQTVEHSWEEGSESWSPLLKDLMCVTTSVLAKHRATPSARKNVKICTKTNTNKHKPQPAIELTTELSCSKVILKNAVSR